MKMTPATAPPQTTVLVRARPDEPAVLGVLVDGPTHRGGHRWVDLGGREPKRLPVSRLRLADGPGYDEATSQAGWRAP